MAYKAPIWEDGKSPAISAENLNNLSQAAEGAQVLCGNSAPTSSTEGAVGQFYLVVVADSDGNYPLYQCVAIANGSYTWRDTRRIPDSITSMLGIPAPGTINRALNVLANVGNLHVWKRVQTYAEEQHTYTLGEKITGVALATGTGAGYQQIWYCSDKITVSDSLEISLVSPSTVNFYSNTTTEEFMSAVAGKFIKYKGHGSEAGLTLSYAGVYFCPGDSAFGNVQYSQYEVYKGITNAQIVTAVTIPAGTTTDYLTSTDRNAYPDNVTDAQDAYYTLGDIVSGEQAMSPLSDSSWLWQYSSSVDISKDGTVSLSSPSSVYLSRSVGSTTSDVLIGKFVRFNMVGKEDDGFIYTGSIFFIPADATIAWEKKSGNSYYGFYLDKYQPVTGHAAIPANTTITYLGQLGGGARIEVGSYVGTGTYGSSNKNSITCAFEPKLLVVHGKFGFDSSHSSIVAIPMVVSSGKYYFMGGSSFSISGTIVLSGNTVSFYSTTDAYSQGNIKGNTYNYIAIG